MAVPIADRILAVLESGLSAWKEYISTRQEAYERKMDRNDKIALKAAATCLRRISELDIVVDDKEYNKNRTKFYKYRGKA